MSSSLPTLSEKLMKSLDELDARDLDSDLHKRIWADHVIDWLRTENSVRELLAFDGGPAIWAAASDSGSTHPTSEMIAAGVAALSASVPLDVARPLRSPEEIVARIFASMVQASDTPAPTQPMRTQRRSNA